MTNPLTERQLDELLSQAGEAVEYPATPELSGGVLRAVVGAATNADGDWRVLRAGGGRANRGRTNDSTNYRADGNASSSGIAQHDCHADLDCHA